MPFAAAAPLPPRPSPEAVRAARHLVTNPDEYLHRDDWRHLCWTAWNTLRIEGLHRRAPLRLCRAAGFPGDAA